MRGVELDRQGDQLEEHHGEEEHEADVHQSGRAEDQSRKAGKIHTCEPNEAAGTSVERICIGL